MNRRFYHVYYVKPGFADEIVCAFIADTWDKARSQGQIRDHALGYPIPEIVGVTRCTLLDDSGEPMFSGYAFCSQRDQFSRRIGRAIALNRAVEELRKFPRTLS